MMGQTMLLEKVLYHSTFLPWLRRFNSITTLTPLDVTTACLLHSPVRPIKRRSIECLGNFCLIGTKDSYSLSIVEARVAWILNDELIGSSTVVWSGINGCQCAVFGNYFSGSWLVFFLGLPSLGFPSYFFLIFHNTSNRDFVFYCMYQYILQLRFISNI